MGVRVLAAGMFGLAALTPPVSAAEDLGGAPGFQAESVTYTEDRDPASTVHVYMAPEGRRLEGIPPRGIALVVPAKGGERWLVDPERKQYAVDRTRNKGATLGGVLAHEPCQGFAKSERVGPATVNGRETVKWKCRHPAFGQVTQWFDPGINTVIKDRTPKGEVQELRRIRVGEQDADLFRFHAGEGFQKVPVIRLFQPTGGS